MTDNTYSKSINKLPLSVAGEKNCQQWPGNLVLSIAEKTVPFTYLNSSL